MPKSWGPPRRSRPDDGAPRGRAEGRGEEGGGLRSWKPRGDSTETPREERARVETQRALPRPPLKARPEGGTGPLRRRPPREEAPPAVGEQPRPLAKPIHPEPRYQALERTNPHVIAAAKTLADAETVVVDIERLVFGGEGLGRFEGVPIFVPRSAPGEKILVRITERRAGWGRAEIVEVLEPSAERREPPCPHFVQGCGGCDLQHLEDAAQLRYKSAALLEALVRQGGVEIPAGVLELIAGDPWAYRLRTQLHVAKSERGKEVGYFARSSHDLVPVEVCPILVPELEKQIPSLPRLLRDLDHERVDLTSGDDRRITCSPPVDNLPHGSVERTIGGFRYEIDARVFFQAHRELVGKLVEVAVGEDGDSEGDAYDLYAGVGLFALPLASRYKRVVAVEGDRVAVRFARRNVKANGVENVAVEALSVDSFVDLLPKNVARVLVDPPRVGLSTPVRRAIIEARPRRLTYVSCHAPTLARDLRELLKIYRLEKLSLLDMFPQTGHMEAVAQLVLQS